MASFRFLHAADIHLDSPLRGLSGQEGSAAVVQSVRALGDIEGQRASAQAELEVQRAHRPMAGELEARGDLDRGVVGMPGALARRGPGPSGSSPGTGRPRMRTASRGRARPADAAILEIERRLVEAQRVHALQQERKVQIQALEAEIATLHGTGEAARQVIEQLRRTAQVQVLFFTHHRHLIDIARARWGPAIHVQQLAD